MSLLVICAAVLVGLLMAFAVTSRFALRIPARLSRLLFAVTISVTAPIACWTLRNLHQTATAVAVAGSFGCAAVLTASVRGLVEDNAPPPPAMREEIIAHHTPGKLSHPREPRGKRTFDVVLASLGVVVSLPLWVLIVVAIWFEEPGPIFFTKNSVGRGGITFRQLKFRSMRYDAERLTGPVAASHRDPRALRVGRWLRRWHLDELPELINVVTGTMSLVGPRPLRAVLVRGYLDEVPGFAERHTVRPGIACIAQIERYHISPVERLRKDRLYLRRAGIGFDIWLLGRAVLTTVRGDRSRTTAAKEGSARHVSAYQR